VPELPDVEQYRRFLVRHAVGHRIHRVRVADTGVLRNTAPAALGRALHGHRFEEPDRLGKWLIAWTGGPAVLFHFGMTGDLGWGQGPEGRHRHDRVIFETDGGELRYRNMRKLGGLWLAHDAEEAGSLLGGLGPDALQIGRREFHHRLAGRRGRLKAALLDQRLLAGVGNLVADEALWQARLHPSRRIEELSDTERDRLYDDLRRVLRDAVEKGDGIPGLPGWLLEVRGGPEARCPRCRDRLERSVVGGRTTYHCPRCQSRPGKAQPS
jgi:formamidopyrimidine-DNA glycosylase